MFSTIDAYEAYARATLESWAPARQIALAAAMAERWLPAYAAFSKSEDWGDPAGLRRSLDAVWAYLRGRLLSPADLSRYLTLIDDATPHQDDFDANEALCACIMLKDALKGCQGAHELDTAVDALLSGLEAVAPDILLEEENQARQWRSLPVRKERQKQQRLLEILPTLPVFDEETIRAFKAQLSKPDMAGQISKTRSDARLAGISNQVAFDQYQRIVAADLKSSAARPALNLDERYFTTLIFAQWSARYLRRLDTIAGNFGKLADTLAQELLVARARAEDEAFKGLLSWDPDTKAMIDLCFRNPLSRLDARSLDQPHGYGPSLRRLWLEARQQSSSDREAWQSITAWSLHRPAAWDVEDRRKKKGRTLLADALGPYLEQEVSWSLTDQWEMPWSAEVNGAHWQVGLNDFPDDFMYRLEVNGSELGKFHDWPEIWSRPSNPFV